MFDKNNIKPLITKEEIQKEILNLANKLNEIYQGEELYLLCVLKGSVMFMTDLAKNLTMPIKMEFIRLSSYGSNTYSSGDVSAVDVSLSDLNNKNVLIVEDIIDTGYTAKFLVYFLNKKYKTKSLRFCSLLNKRAKRQVNMEADYYCFDVEDKFLVGYGLDYDGYYRNFPYIGYVTV